MSHPYDRLSPDTVLDAIERCGLLPDGRVLALNSYENRVFQIGIEDGPGVVAKFYRPDRWSDAAILEEHGFSLALAADEIPVVAPLAFDGETLLQHAGFRYALFPKRGGRAPELDDLSHLEWIGRFIGRIHLLGQARRFQHRPNIDGERLGRQAREALLASGHLPAHHEARYAALSLQVIEEAEQHLRQIAPRHIRLHGDCHPGNILWTDAGPHFVDMDDCANGPAVADLWMLLSGERQEMQMQLNALLSGYRTFCAFDTAELGLIEALRSLRLLHYTSWLGQRWDDPAFPLAFPWFEDEAYWQSYLADLEQQILRLREPPLATYP
jgi:Ser/Thr protein kinase RdoA (MazF antagonist)